MKLNTLFTINAVIASLFGLAFLVFPQQTLAQYAIEVSGAAAGVMRFFGASLLGFGILTWLCRNSGESDARNAIVMALFLSDAIGTVVALYLQLSGMVNAMGWTTVVIYALLAVGFGMFAFKK